MENLKVDNKPKMRQIHWFWHLFPNTSDVPFLPNQQDDFDSSLVSSHLDEPPAPNDNWDPQSNPKVLSS